MIVNAGIVLTFAKTCSFHGIVISLLIAAAHFAGMEGFLLVAFGLQQKIRGLRDVSIQHNQGHQADLRIFTAISVVLKVLALLAAVIEAALSHVSPSPAPSEEIGPDTIAMKWLYAIQKPLE